jgi:hypothetical protein
VRRIALTLTSRLAGSDAGRVIVDAFSSLTSVARIATAASLAPIVARRNDLPVATIEPIASEFARLAERKSDRVTVRNGGADWRREILSSYLPRLDRRTTRARMLTNAAIVLMQRDEQFETGMLEAAYDHAESTLKSVHASKAGAA